MEHFLTDRLYNKILEELLNLEFLQEFSLRKRLIKKHIKNISFREKINQILENRTLSTYAVLDLCKNLMNELAQEPPEDWLYYIYQFTLSKSFKEAVEIQLLECFKNSCIIYLKVLKIFLAFEKEIDHDFYTIDFLTSEEERELENSDEYKCFKKAFEDDYVYEMMKLNKEVIGHYTLDHVCGVHTLALYIGRQLKEIGLCIDLGRVSGAAAGHDIGKFGCKGDEQKRTPYLHYYYTDQWFKNHDITYIRNIAVNHSTWDLELENLSLESLILIYCDFRVKKKRTEDGKSKMHIYSLKESFQVILKKLDNVDEAKEKRYYKVYAKLKDFEDYMIHSGVNTNIIEKSVIKMKKIKHYSLMQGKEIIENIKDLSIHHNIHLMYKLRDEFSLNAILESARSEMSLNNLRGYLYVFEEYSTYMTQKQKMITIKFLYEHLIHPEEDIRKQCAELIGLLIANFDEKYGKEIPQNVKTEKIEMKSDKLLDKTLQMLIYPDHQTLALHRTYLGSSMHNMIKALFLNSSSHRCPAYMEVLSKYYRRDYTDREIQIHLLETLKYLPMDHEVFLDTIIRFNKKMLGSRDDHIRLHALEIIYCLLKKSNEYKEFNTRLKGICITEKATSNIFVEQYLIEKIKQYLDEENIEKYENQHEYDKKISDMFLSNLKTATEPIIKKVQIDFLFQYAMDHLDRKGLYTAMHFCNILKVSASESVRNHAGRALLKLLPNIPFEQRNDVVIELLRGLEIEGYQFVKYIPNYLGRLVLTLRPIELDAFIDDLIEKIKKSHPQINVLLLETVGIAIEHYHKYKNVFEEEDKDYKKRLVKMLGILLNGLVHYNHQVKQTAFRVIGKDIFGSENLNLEQKNHIFTMTAKKLLTLIGDENEEKILTFFTHAAGLNHIYRFISDYKFYKGDMLLKEPDKIAFFPGTFDPFSLSHKEIATEIRSLGFEVYLAVDEFSWSKKTQPNLIRRNIIKMSIADELDIHLYPEDLPVNIANHKDLRKLRKAFPNSDVHIVAGSDVVLNASAYKKGESENSICSFSHIIFERKSAVDKEDDDKRIEEAIKNIKNNVIRLSLPPQYEDISSTQIRNYIDQNVDISRLIDPIAQKYIYEKGLYRREPRYKTLMETKSVSVELVTNLTDEFLQGLASLSYMNWEGTYEKLKSFSRKLNSRVLLLRSIERDGEILGFSAFHWLRSSMIFKEFEDEAISEYIRNHAIGRILVIDGIFTNSKAEFDNMEQIVLTETLAYALPKDYTYAVYKSMADGHRSSSVDEILRCQGFLELSNNKNTVFAVNMATPVTLYLDIEAIIKEPFRSSKRVEKSIKQARRKVQEAITRLYPGNLVLSFDRNMIYENLIKKICDENGVPIIPSVPRELGPYMCAPFGSILNGVTIPNTVTKSMHTEKIFDPDMKNFRIAAYPYYLDLINQVKMIHSFDRPVILVDDLLNKGYRIKAIDPLFKKENITVNKIIVGILSGRGKELMDMQNREVDCAYFIPKLKVWFNESLLYPFIGGDTIWRGDEPKSNLVPSVNFILPYTVPTFITETSKDAIYHLSQICIENAMDILTTIEEEYEKIHERSLTLKHLGEVFIAPRYPDHGKDMHYDMNLSPSHYLKNDLEHLRRLKSIIF